MNFKSFFGINVCCFISEQLLIVELGSYDATALSPLRGAVEDLSLRILEERHRHQSTSTTHQFRENHAFLSAGTDVIALSSLGGAEGDSSLRILKERPRLHNCVLW